jgi:hypothetical protein
VEHNYRDRAHCVLGTLALWTTIAWCGHRPEGIPVPDTNRRWRLIVVEGEAP